MDKEIFNLLEAIQTIKTFCADNVCNRCPLWSKEGYEEYECPLRCNKKRPEQWDIEFDAKIRI